MPHGNGCSSVNMHAMDLVHISKDSYWLWPSFEDSLEVTTQMKSVVTEPAKTNSKETNKLDKTTAKVSSKGDKSTVKKHTNMDSK